MALSFKFKQRHKGNQKGQAVLEYTLMIMFVMGVFVAILRPEIGKVMDKFSESFSSGIFQESDSGDAFYRFRVR